MSDPHLYASDEMLEDHEKVFDSGALFENIVVYYRTCVSYSLC